jgi:hypothetical protein
MWMICSQSRKFTIYHDVDDGRVSLGFFGYIENNDTEMVAWDYTL